MEKVKEEIGVLEPSKIIKLFPFITRMNQDNFYKSRHEAVEAICSRVENMLGRFSLNETIELLTYFNRVKQPITKLLDKIHADITKPEFSAKDINSLLLLQAIGFSLNTTRFLPRTKRIF